MFSSGVTIDGLEPLFAMDVRLVTGKPGGAPVALSAAASDSEKKKNNSICAAQQRPQKDCT